MAHPRGEMFEQGLLQYVRSVSHLRLMTETRHPLLVQREWAGHSEHKIGEKRRGEGGVISGGWGRT